MHMSDDPNSETVSEDAAPTTDPQPTPEKATDLDKIIDKWWDDFMPGSPLSIVTDAYNHAYAALAELKRRLKGG